METIATIAELRRQIGIVKLAGKTVGVVPTMGALHQGHISLIDQARAGCDIVAMTLFVNPTQFNDPSDFAKYPRHYIRDEEMAASAGVDIVFLPDPTDIYPDGFSTTVSVGALSTILEGASRAGHFDGVATVVTKLLNIVRADRAYFGLKDYQQLQIVRRLTQDLDIGTEIVACPTVREPDGLAMSSRNVRLSPEQRKAAVVLSQALSAAKDSVGSGERSGAALMETMTSIMNAEPLANLDYAAVAHPETLETLESVDPNTGAVALIAAKFGDVRLIDSLKLC